MSKTSAGILLYRRRAGRLEIFLVHMGGPYWKNKEKGAWTIPKGECVEGEDPRVTALREFREETGFDLTGPMTELEPARQASGKLVRAWAVEGEVDAAAIRSNTFEMEWPPRSGKKQSFPEVDRAEWFEAEAAKELVIKGQEKLIDQISNIE